jgi:hypothetical protein
MLADGMAENKKMKYETPLWDKYQNGKEVV